MARTSDETRRRLLAAARSVFAHRGYGAASVALITSQARVTKPALYYHFGNKAGLHEALVVEALEERYRAMCAAAAASTSLEERLTGVLEACFRHARENRELTRICYSALFAPPGEVPHHTRCMERGARNFEFVRGLFLEAIRRGELPRGTDTRELTAAIYSRIVAFSLSQLVKGRSRWPDNARQTVRTFLRGAAG